MIINYSLIALLAAMFAWQIYTVKKYEKLNKSRETFVAGVTHDLKSPTRAQINILNLLLKEEFGTLNSKQQEMLKLTCGSSKYMSNLVNTILTKYECDCSKLKLNFSGFNLYDLIKSVCAENEYLTKEKEQKIVLDNLNIDLFVYGDKLQIERVIFNLLSNAIIHGFRNSSIRISAEKTKNCVNFCISNRSYPICESDLKNIFNQFSSKGKNKLNPTSTGLGLYVSKKIIELHKGQIYAQSSQDGLCKFGFRLPVNQYERKLLKTGV